MPYYEYHCLECDKIFEIFQHMDEPELRYSKHTHGSVTDNDQFLLRCSGPIERKISAPMLKFVGKGFYVNDYPTKHK